MTGAHLLVLVCGALFGFGLTEAWMVRPEVVLSFLRFEDLGLLLVLGSALAVALAAYQLAPRLIRRPVTGGVFRAHRLTLTRRTMVGAGLFGIGWGICGVCPGPAIAGVGAGNWPVLVALAGMLLGAWAQGRFFPD